MICGDAHLGNFGFYASPERDLVLDLNDFDEAHPGPWEWDLRRLVTSICVAGRQNGSQESQCEDAVMSCVAAYRHSVRVLANQPLLSRSFQRVDVDLLHTTVNREIATRRRSPVPLKWHAREPAIAHCPDSPPNAVAAGASSRDHR